MQRRDYQNILWYRLSMLQKKVEKKTNNFFSVSTLKRLTNLFACQVAVCGNQLSKIQRSRHFRAWCKPISNGLPFRKSHSKKTVILLNDRRSYINYAFNGISTTSEHVRAHARPIKIPYNVHEMVANNIQQHQPQPQPNRSKQRTKNKL